MSGLLGHDAQEQMCTCEAQLQQQWSAGNGEAAHALSRQGTL